ncbi:MAG: Methyltransferase type 12 [Candidatus Gottesmanbacteria bacterium GW2011_GWA1_43_11]|uniref:Methyltransferase type 12 n=1 Tax=Candidatus Gottesmanbacteria bacterium GW2011_GWA1_43_11 TaxID=1618436 RepID=A0A0G1CC62_9BACT|nr:MAG: Methyltransferase type 12 [Candidatus Gottesmanbacteria bacterium GW2011_GWA1_43_11]
MLIRKSCSFCQKKALKTKYTFEDYSIFECTHCGFIFRDRKLNRIESEAIYGKNYFLKSQKDYFSNCLVPNPKNKSKINDFNSRLDLLEKNIKKSEGIKLLDIGAGTGSFGYLANKRGWKTVGVEISLFAANLARKKFNVKVYHGEVTDKNFKLNNFDIVTMWEVIANIEETSKLLKKINSILNRNGEVAILTTVVDSWLYDVAKLIYNLSFGKISYFTKEGYPLQHSNHFTRKNLRKALKKNGFKIIYHENREIPFKYTKLPKYYLPMLIILGQLAKIFGRTIQYLVIAKKV